MLQPSTFHRPQLQREINLWEKIQARQADGTYAGGLVGEQIKLPTSGEVVNLLHIGNPYADTPEIITLPCRSTPYEVEQIRSEIIPMQESHEILMALAVAWKMNHMLYIEGETSIGKTYLVERFVELLYGRGVKPIDAYCVEETEATELLGKWLPYALTSEDHERFQQYLREPFAATRLTAIQAELNEAGGLSPERFEALARTRLQELADEAGLHGGAQWRFQRGAILMAMTASLAADGMLSFKPQGGDGDGLLLHVQEIGLARPGVANVFLQLGGQHGKTRGEPQLFQNGGHCITAGTNFRVVFTNNPAKGRYLKRNPIDPALERRCDVLRLGDLCADSYRLAALKYFSYQVGNRPELTFTDHVLLDLTKQAEISKEVAILFAAFHQEFKQRVDGLTSGARTDDLAVTLDYMAKCAEYIAACQVCSPQTGMLDICQTLRQAVERNYIGRLPAGKVGEVDLRASVRAQFETLLTHKETASKQFRGELRTRQDILNLLVREASRATIEVRTERDQVTAENNLTPDDLVRQGNIIKKRIMASRLLSQRNRACLEGKLTGGHEPDADFRNRRIAKLLKDLKECQDKQPLDAGLEAARDILLRISRYADPTAFFGLRDPQTREVLALAENTDVRRVLHVDGEVSCMSCTPRGDKLLIGTFAAGEQPGKGTGRLMIASTAEGAKEETSALLFRKTLPPASRPLAFSPDFSRLAVESEGKLKVYPLSAFLKEQDEPAPLCEIDLRGLDVKEALFSPAGNMLAVLTHEKGIGLGSNLQVAVMEEGQVAFMGVEQHFPNRISALAFEAEGQSLFFGQATAAAGDSANALPQARLESAAESEFCFPRLVEVKVPGHAIEALSSSLSNQLVVLSKDQNEQRWLSYHQLSSDQLKLSATTEIKEEVDEVPMRVQGNLVMLKHPIRNSDTVSEVLGNKLAAISIYRVNEECKASAVGRFICPDNPPWRAVAPAVISPDGRKIILAVNRWNLEHSQDDALLGVFETP